MSINRGGLMPHIYGIREQDRVMKRQGDTVLEGETGATQGNCIMLSSVREVGRHCDDE